MQAQAKALVRMGILFPMTGLDPDLTATRPGAMPGHQGLLTALRSGDDGPWRALADEVRLSRAGRVVLSCENLILPFDTERGSLIEALFARLQMFAAVQPVALVRRPDVALESLWREVVCLGRREGARSVAEFAVDHAPLLTDLPQLLGPFERGAGLPVRLADFDALRAAGQLWPGFLALCGLTGAEIAALPEVPGLARYPTPGAGEVALARMLNALIAVPDTRVEVLRAFFAGAEASGAEGQFPVAIGTRAAAGRLRGPLGGLGRGAWLRACAGGLGGRAGGRGLGAPCGPVPGPDRTDDRRAAVGGRPGPGHAPHGGNQGGRRCGADAASAASALGAAVAAAAAALGRAAQSAPASDR